MRLRPFKGDQLKDLANVQVEVSLDTPITFLVDDPNDIVWWPESIKKPTQKEELWKHTCAELFIKSGIGPQYVEWNWSPSGEWMLYFFKSYRQPCDMVLGINIQPLEIKNEGKGTKKNLQIRWDADELEPFLGAQPWIFRPTMVLETKGEELSFWAATHPCSQPDFHHPKNF